MSTPPEVPIERGLRSNRDFMVVLSGQAASALGDAITLTALPLLVLSLTGSGALMGTVAALQLAPSFFLQLPAGALADRWDRRRLMVWTDAGRAILTAAIPLSHWAGMSTMAVILIVAVPVNALRVLSDAAFSSAVPDLVGRSHLARANGYMEATLSVPFIIGPAVAGVLVATIGAPGTLAIDALSFAASAVSMTFVRRTLRAERPAEMPSVLADIKEGISWVARHVLLRTLVAYATVIAVATAAVVPALAYAITIDQGHGPQLFGLVGSSWSVGYLLGSLAADRLAADRVGLRILASGAMIGLPLLAIGVLPHPAVFLIGAFFVGAALAVQLVSYLTLRAVITPDALLGRVGSTSRTLTVGLQPLAFLGFGALSDTAGGGGALVTMGLIAIAASLIFSTSRTLRAAVRV